MNLTRPAARGETVRPKWPIALMIVALIALSATLDPAVSTWLSSERVRPVLERLLGKEVPAPGIVDQWAPLVILLAILISLPKGGRLCVGFLVPILVHLPVLHLLKWAIGRARPLAQLGAFHFAPFSGAKYADSFPSGHAALPAITALVLGLYFPRARWVFYVWALVEGLKRMVMGWHYLSDVLAGYALAALVVYVCHRGLGAKFYPRRAPPSAG